MQVDQEPNTNPGNSNNSDANRVKRNDFNTVRTILLLKSEASKMIKTPLDGSATWKTFNLELELALTTFEDNVKLQFEDFDDDIAMDTWKCQIAFEHFVGDALRWFTTASGKDSEYKRDWNLLRTSLIRMYDDPNREFTAYGEWIELKMEDKLDAYESKFDELTLVLPQMPESILVHHYIHGLKPDIRSEVLSYFVAHPTERGLQSARQQARVFFNVYYSSARTPNPLKKAKVRTDAGNYKNSGAGTSTGYSGGTSAFGPDSWLKRNVGKFQFSADYPRWIPTTLKGKLSDERGSVGHKLKKFCMANDLCLFCRNHGHQAKDCQHLKKQGN